MSLLLNALKKAEEGEGKKEEGGDNAAAQTTAAAAIAPGAVAAEAGAADKPVAAKGEGISLKAGEPAAKPAAAVDFDAIIDSGAKAAEEPVVEAVAEAADTGKKERKRVSAARIFAAAGQQQESDTGGGRKIVYAVAGVVMVALAGGGLLYSGLIPGFTLGGFLGYDLGGERVAQRQVAEEAPLQLDSGGGGLLPVPEVDVQAEIDFAVSNLPDDVAGDGNLAEKISFLTGYNLGGAEEAPQEGAQDDFVDELVEEEAEEEIVYDEIVSAERSRNRKFDVDARTPSDSQIEIKLVSANSSDPEEEAAPSEPAPERAVAQASTGEVKVEASQEGIDRTRALEDAKKHYYGGNFARAEAVYRDLLRQSPTNLDALRGLALIAVATRRYQLAASTYLQILDYYPNDPVAVAELVNLQGGVDFNRVERSLKKILGKHPSADGRLHFTLGNLYASRERWLEAQKSYFQAFSIESDNPDYAYNLAVVLDYLNKSKLAVRYYREALGLAGGSPVGFDAAQVRARLRDLDS